MSAGIHASLGAGTSRSQRQKTYSADQMAIDSDSDDNVYREEEDEDDEDDYVEEEDEEDDDDDDRYINFEDSLRAAQNINLKRRKQDDSDLQGLSEKKKERIRKKRQFFHKTYSTHEDPEVRDNLSKGYEAFATGDYDSATTYFTNAIKVDPKNAPAYLALGEIALDRGEVEKCCSYWKIAANTSHSSCLIWTRIADLYEKLGNLSEAIHGYTKAIATYVDNREVSKDSLYQTRAHLYKETKQYGRALDGFRKLFEKYPTNPTYAKELASTYLDDRRTNDAIRLYTTILDQNMNPRANEKFPKFGWTELNILSELHISRHSWLTGLKVIKVASRFIQDRTDEKFWDDVDNDAEFDSRRSEVIQNKRDDYPNIDSREYDLPIDIRFKLGQVRLELGNKEEALRHFNFVLEEEDEVIDLLLDAGKCLEKHAYFNEALVFLTRALYLDDDPEMETITLLGSCYLEVGEYENALQAFNSALELAPSDTNIRILLAETLLRLGDDSKAEALLAEISGNDKKITRDFPQRDSILGRSRGKLTEEQKLAAEEEATRKVLDDYRRMERLESDIASGNQVAISTWIHLATRLINTFTSVSSFFPRDKNRAFKGILRYRRRSPMEVNERIARVYDLFDDIGDDEEKSRLFLTSEKEFRGLDYDTWFKIFIQFSILNAKFKNDIDYAIYIVDLSMDVNVFVQDKTKELISRMVKLVFGLFKGDYSIVLAYVRFFLSSNQFSPFIYKFFLSCFASGGNSWNTFSNYNHQKYFLRQLKAFDSIVSSKKITGMATITADLDNVKLEKEHIELLYIYANLLGGYRNYISPIVYLNRAYKQYNKDPMICLTLGLAHVHRSMQRLSANRHIQLLQGISYIMEYRELRLANGTDYEKQETEFNMARLFHMLGLTYEAVTHYNNVLLYHEAFKDDPDYDLLMEAAYNLSLIYNINGNSELAGQLTQKYLTV